MPLALLDKILKIVFTSAVDKIHVSTTAITIVKGEDSDGSHYQSRSSPISPMTSLIPFPVRLWIPRNYLCDSSPSASSQSPAWLFLLNLITVLEVVYKWFSLCTHQGWQLLIQRRPAWHWALSSSLTLLKWFYMTSEGSKVILRFVSGRVLNSEQARADYCVPLEYFFVPSFWPEFS